MRALLGLGLLLAAPAFAADVDLFTPSGSVVQNVGTLQGEAPILGGDGLSLGLMAWAAEDLAVVQYADGSSKPLMASAFALPIYGGYTINGRARIEALVPLYLYANAPDNSFRGAAFGDLEIRSMVPVYAPSRKITLGVVPAIALPTGTKSAYLGQGFEGRLTLAAAGMPDPRAGWVANVKLTGAPSDVVHGETVGSRMDVIGGGWWQAEPAFRLGADVDMGVGLAQQADTQRLSVLTAHVFGQITANRGVSLIVGGGGGLGLGAPAYRVFTAVTWAPSAADRDGDGIPDDKDACPDKAEDKDGYQDADGCPDLDNDGDGIPDAQDKCPNEAEDKDGYQDADGCPDLDNDGDGILDTEDHCPNSPGSAAHHGCGDADNDGVFDDVDLCPKQAGTAATGGCPDRDGDLVPDYRDKCPDEPGPSDADPTYSDGCPEVAYVTPGGAIKITQKIQFALGSTAISEAAKPVLDQVVAVLKAHPEIGLLEVQGHTDNIGTPDRNMEISQERAETVATYLRDKGIAPGRLMPKGYGETEPIDTNHTAAGRANNRRIEFRVRRWNEPPRAPGSAAPGPASPAPAPATPAPASAAPAPVTPAPAPATPAPETSPPAVPAPATPAPAPAGPSPWGATPQPTAPAPAPQPATPAPGTIWK